MKKLILLAVTLSLVSLMGCATGSPASKGKTKEILSYNDVLEVKTLSILNGAGTVNIGKSTSDNVEIECSVSYDGKSYKNIKSMIEQFSLSPQITEDILFLEVDTKDSINVESWLSGDIDYININYDIKLPDYIIDVRIINILGNINVKDIEGSFSIESYTGNFDLQNISLIGNSHINLASGNIDLNATDISNSQVISSKIKSGNITYNLPDDADYITGNTSVPDFLISEIGEDIFSEEELKSYRNVLMNPTEKVGDNFAETMIVCKAESGNVKIK